MQGVNLLEELGAPLPRPLDDVEPLELAVAPRAARLELLLPRCMLSYGGVFVFHHPIKRVRGRGKAKCKTTRIFGVALALSLQCYCRFL